MSDNVAQSNANVFIEKEFMNRFGVIHLSDLQFGKNHRFKDTADFIRKLVSDIRKMSQEHHFRPLFIVLSGDISETGCADEFNEALIVITELASKLNIDRKKILCIPGNHDVNWKLAIKSKILKKVMSILKTTLRIDFGMLCKKLGSDQLKFHPYNNFVKTLTNYQENQSEDCYIRIIEKIPINNSEDQAALELEFLLLNSCEKEDHKNHEGYVCKEKLLKTLQTQTDEDRLRIAIMHHRLDTIPKEIPGIINARDIISVLIGHKYNIVLTGHVHYSRANAKDNGEGHITIQASCGSTGVTKEAREDGIQNQYCIHIIDFGKNKLQTVWRAFNPAYQTENGRGGWTQDNSFQEGLTEFTLPIVKQKQTVDSQVRTEAVSSSKHTLVSKTEREKMKLAFLNLLGGWKENG